MKKIIVLAVCCMMAVTSWAQMADSLALQEVVVTGTRNATDVRHLPMTVNVIGRQQLTEQHQTSVLPTVMQQVPGIFVTSRSMLGYGVSTGADRRHRSHHPGLHHRMAWHPVASRWRIHGVQVPLSWEI